MDLLIKNGRVFDGSQAASDVCHIAVDKSQVVAIQKAPFDDQLFTRVIDAQGLWVMPGFLDTHTHYDAEVLAQPSLKESVRHGVTTVTIGSCSIGMALCDAEDSADLFTRVESIPREYVLPLLQDIKQWQSPKEYVNFLSQHSLGPNLTCFLGHSELRARVMGLGNAVNPDKIPDESQMRAMEQLLGEAMDAGMLGLSTMTTRWDKLDGDRYRSASLPSTYARWKEFRRLNKVLRRRGRLHQGAPDIVTKWNMVLFLWESMGLMGKPLKTTLISMMDLKANRLLVKPVAWLTKWVNKLFNADFRWQALPNRFEVYADGIDLVIFEEFGSGEAALHLKDEVERNELLQNQSYRRWFRKDYENKWGPRVWQRNFYEATIINCPDTALEGKTFGELADRQKLHPADVFLDLVVKYGSQLRWHTVIANDRNSVLEHIVNHPSAVISFADSGAHIRNMAFYNFPLRLLQLVYLSHQRNQPVMSMEKAVWRLTGELADWFGIDAGYVKTGKRADIVIIDPDKLNLPLDAYHEDTIPAFGDIERMVNRNDGLVKHVIINGKPVFDGKAFVEDFGESHHYGQFLKAKD
jgi:N-acyl-D-aspartate/D-glutamate deacylase